MNIYGIRVKGTDGREIPLSDYKGKVLLIVNTATGCGFTPQYEHLQKLYETYGNRGFEVLDFPCNQFANQTPGSDEEISTFCTLNYGTTFPRFAKTEVNGAGANELFRYLTGNTRFAGFDPAHKLSGILDKILSEADPDYRDKPDIKWNFTKFLIDRAGNIVARFEPTHDMADVEAKIVSLL